VARFDRSLRDERHLANHGTTADLTAASIFVLIVESGWQGGQGRRG
jgi:triphosphoribosyl-dephospho-CoA synthetase